VSEAVASRRPVWRGLHSGGTLGRSARVGLRPRYRRRSPAAVLVVAQSTTRARLYGGHQQDAPECLAALDVWVCGAGIGERERPVDLDAQPAVCHLLEQLGDHRVYAGILVEERPAQEDPAQRVVLQPEAFRLDLGAGSPGHSDADEGP